MGHLCVGQQREVDSKEKIILTGWVRLLSDQSGKKQKFSISNKIIQATVLIK